MSHGNTANKTGGIHEDVKPPEVSEDFKLYLDAVTAASLRTRSTLYVLVAIVVLTLTAYRNTFYPDWLDSRLAHLQLASACLEKGEPFTSNCQESINYSKGFLFTGRTDELLSGTEFKRELTEQITAFVRQRTDALSLRLPFFGVVIDINDLGLVTGIFLAFVLYVLHAGLYREVDNLDRSMTKALQGTPRQQKERFELLLMAQVLASRKGATLGVHILLIGVLVMHFFVVRGDWLTSNAAVALQGRFWGTWETRIDLALFLVVAGLCVLCWLVQNTLDRKVDELIAKVA
jgi:hypothetical protein